MTEHYSFDEFKRNVSEFLHHSLTADIGTLERSFEAIQDMYQKITPSPQGTLKIVASSTLEFVSREYKKSNVKLLLKNISV